MTKKIIPLTLLSALLNTSTTFAGSMGPAETSDNALMFEAGGVYSYVFYIDQLKTAETYTFLTPNGISSNPSKVYPNNFWGGYIEASYFMKNLILFNARYDMYGQKTNTFARGPSISLSPVKLSFTADRVWGNFNAFSYGLGAGVVLATNNKGESFYVDNRVLPNGQLINPTFGKSIQGRNRIDPLVEGFAMYKVTQNFGIRWNLAYEIPMNNLFANGSLNTNLGINYTLPV